MARRMRRRLGFDLSGSLADDVARSGLRPPADPVGAAAVVVESDLAELPEVVQKYFRFMGAVGRPRIWSFRGRFVGRFRLGPSKRWSPCEAVQHNAAPDIVRIFRMRVDLFGVLPVAAVDRYDHGRGSMVGKLLGTVTVAEGAGFELDLGELTTYLDDALLYAPSMLLGPATTWTGIDDHSFSVTLRDQGLESTVQVTTDGRGAPLTVSTTDRFASIGGGLVRARWNTPVAEWTSVGGRRVPAAAAAVWDLPDGPFTYVEGALDPTSIEWNVGGAEMARPAPTEERRLHQAAEALGAAARVAGNVVTAPVRRRRTNRWGATQAEVDMPLPGDELVPKPRMRSTRAVTIGAPPEAVWAWLVQIGHGRGGLYSYDSLENLFGCDLHSADRVVDELQALAVGDRISLGPDGYPAFRVAMLEPGQSLTLVSADPATGLAVELPVRRGQTASTWHWTLLPQEGGRATRLIARQRYAFPTRMSALWHVVEPIDFVMERRMLLGIKQRAEGALAPA